MAKLPKLFVCHGDDGGPRMHPCRRVQEALREAGVEYDKEIAAHGSPIPFLRKGSRDELRAQTGSTKLPALKLPDGTVLVHSGAILAWVRELPSARTRDGESLESRIRTIWNALAEGDFEPLQAALAPDAQWRAVEDGPWNCDGREEIVGVLRRNRAGGGTPAMGGEVLDVIDLGDRAVVAFRPGADRPAPWPLEDGLRHVAVSTRAGLIVELKGCATRAEAMAYLGR